MNTGGDKWDGSLEGGVKFAEAPSVKDEKNSTGGGSDAILRAQYEAYESGHLVTLLKYANEKVHEVEMILATCADTLTTDQIVQLQKILLLHSSAIGKIERQLAELLQGEEVQQPRLTN